MSVGGDDEARAIRFIEWYEIARTSGRSHSIEELVRQFLEVRKEAYRDARLEQYARKP
jgi:hypothetical protein